MTNPDSFPTDFLKLNEMNFGVILKSTAVIAATLLCSSCLVGRYMVDYALLPEEHGNDIEGDRKVAEQRYPGIIEWYDTLVEQGVFKDTTTVGYSHDGKEYKLWAMYAPASDPSIARGTAIVVHGYTDNHICFLNLVRMYRDELNYNVFVPDLHYHGYSEGSAVRMGWFDRYDVEKFVVMAHDIFNNDFEVLHGVSMGAATVMMVSGDENPPYLRAVVEDCGYASVWGQYKHSLKALFHLPTFPVLNSANVVCRHRYGWDFKEASSVDQVSKSTLPILFIHGDNDDFVLTSDVYEVYNAKTEGYKEIWLAPGSAHAMSYKDHPEEYTTRVRSFLDKVRDENL